MSIAKQWIIIFILCSLPACGVNESTPTEKDGGGVDLVRKTTPAWDQGTPITPDLAKIEGPVVICRPDCEGRGCGPDGCGGSCGDCGPSRTCDEESGICYFPCKPNCNGKQCGDDGCGGSCGTCSEGSCQNNTCKLTYPWCKGNSDCPYAEQCFFETSTYGQCTKVCDLYNPGGQCPGNWVCKSIVQDPFTLEYWPWCAAPGPKGEGESCSYTSSGHDCQGGLLCLSDLLCHRFCDATHPCPKPDQSCWNITLDGVETPFAVCDPAFTGCDPNPCDQLHRSICSVINGTPTCACDPGYHEEGGQCVKTCFPSCTGKTCGDDGCGGSCGECGANQACTPTGTCCTPDCSGKECGTDGCGGSCGECAANLTCTSTGACCTPSCAGKQCGPDGCGGVCGSCTSGASCSTDGQCLCIPDCSFKECGSDGCGGSCGSCAGAATCTSGACVMAPTISNLRIYTSPVYPGYSANAAVYVTDQDGLAGLELELDFSGPSSQSVTISIPGATGSVTAADVSFNFELSSQSPTGYYTLTVRAIDGDGNRSNPLSESFSVE